MYTPFALFLNYHSSLPWWLGPVLQVAGFGLMWLSRQTAWAYPRWGRKYYVFSAIARPLGIALISWAWVEICCVDPPKYFGQFQDLRLVLICAVVIIALVDSALQPIMASLLIISTISAVPRMMDIYPIDFSGDIIILMQLLLLVGFYSLWSIFALGLRPSFLYGGMGDQLITTGPYQYQRHPQLLAALALVFFSSFLVRVSLVNYDRMIAFRMVNFMAMVGLMIVLIRQEEKELKARFKENYLNYMLRVPALISWKRNRPHTRLRFAFSATLVSLILAATIYGLTPFRDFDSFITFGMKPEKNVGYWFIAIQRDLSNLVRDIEPGREFTTQKLPEKSFKSFSNYWRASIFTPYPQTLFFCDQVRFDDHQPGDMENLRVRKLPFPLRCNEYRLEMAQAMDYDGDGFARIDMFILDRPKDNYRYSEKYILAADDDSDTFDPLVLDRLK
jgi:protein-S-isoprenylcysteine O-methyltransferase Ste14